MKPKNEPLVGGSYLVKDGVRTLVEEPTKDHPEGNRAREADGKAIAAPDETHANPQSLSGAVDGAAGSGSGRARRASTTEGAA